MSYNRPGKGTHVVNSTGGNLTHNQPAVLNGLAGVVVKQKGTAWSAGLVTPAVIANGEKCWMITKGIVQVDNAAISGATKGDPVYITTANALTTTVGTNAKFGRVVELIGDGRSVPTGKVRIDLDTKDSF
jgi:hypothetical protein